MMVVISSRAPVLERACADDVFPVEGPDEDNSEVSPESVAATFPGCLAALNLP